MSEAPLDQLLDPLTRSLSDKQVRQIMNWRLNSETQTRLERLRNGANEGTLSPDEAARWNRFRGLSCLRCVRPFAAGLRPDHHVAFGFR